MAPKRIIVDLDVGTDDAVALYMLLHAEKMGNIKIEALIATRGNTLLEHSTKNLVRILELAERIDIPVYRGSHNYLALHNRYEDHLHGIDGFGDLFYEREPNMTVIKEELWISALYKLVRENPKEISLLCLAPLTNIAIPLRIYNDFAENLKEIYLMGGNYTGMGNITTASEFNFYCDPEAADVVLRWAKCPITIVPWECCKNSTVMTFKWRFEKLGELGGPLWNLITKAEESVYKSYDREDYWTPCDAFLIFVFLNPEESILNKFRADLSVELHGHKTRGQVVVDHLSINNSNIEIVENVNIEFFMQELIKACKAETQS